MTLLDIVAALLVLSALFGFINHKLLHLPHTIGLVVIALAASLVIVTVDAIWPGLQISEVAERTLISIDFHDVLLNGFLSALLFAGAVHVDLTQISQRKWTIGLLATVGVLISTAVTGGLIWLAGHMLGAHLPLTWALVFGALISPTDPVAVLAIMRHVRVPPPLHATISGESLLNDGVGVVVFTILLAVATGTAAEGGAIGPADVLALFGREAVGGAALGLATGLVAYLMMSKLDEHNIEVMITLALVSATYALGLKLGVSGPIAVVVAGVLIGNHGAKFAMSSNTREHVFQFWDLIGELLNTILFLLIGLEVLIVGRNFDNIGLALAAIPIVLIARLVSVFIPIGVLGIFGRHSRGAIRILTWGGLRGGISVALALSLPDDPYKATILTATYMVVVFSILAQGLTIKRVVERVCLRDA
jgi:CPA1 family monovalent cation:H+ antiporter